MENILKIKYMSEEARKIYEMYPLQTSTPLSCGYDLRACLNTAHEGVILNYEKELQVSILPKERVWIPLGIAYELNNSNFGGFLYSRSGLGAKTGLAVAGGVCVIDSDYRGEISVFMLNTSNTTITIQNGARIAQLIFKEVLRPKVVISDSLSQTERGSGGYGHTGLL